MRHAPALVAVALTVLALGPALAPGFVLTYDMVFVPKVSFTRELFGLGTAVPRAVPSDLLVAVSSRVISVAAAQKLILVGIFLGAALGAARLVPSRHPAAQAAAGVFYAWNAYVFERLVMGHWAFLLSFAAFPWVVRAAIDLRTGAGGAWRLVGALAIASLGGFFGGVVGPAMAILVLVAPPYERRRRSLLSAAVLTLAAGLVLNLPWLIPSLLRPGGVPFRPEGIAAFAARSDSPLGTAGSLLSLGGIWNHFVVPPGRGSWTWVPAFVLLMGIAVWGWRHVFQRWPRGAGAGLMATAGLGFLVAMAASVPGLRDGLRLVVQHVPGGGLLRDSQKFVAPLVLVESVGFGVGVERVLSAIQSTQRQMAAAILVVAPIALLPALAWGATGRLRAVHYPHEWDRARAIMAADPVRGAVLVLPWHLYVAFPWNANRAMLDPSSRYFTRRALLNNDIELVSGTIRGEDPWAELARPVVESSGPLSPRLASIGARYVLVRKIGDWRSFLPRLLGLANVLDSPTLALYRGSPAEDVHLRTPSPAPVIAGDMAAALLASWAGAQGVLALRRRAMLSFGLPRSRRTDGRNNSRG